MEKKHFYYLIENIQLFGEDDTPADPPADPTDDDPTAKYLKAIEELKKNSVPKDELEKLKKENKALLESIVDGKDLPASVLGSIDNTDSNQKRMGELREILFGPNRRDLSNLDTAKALVELRDLCIEETGEDPVISAMKNPTVEDAKAASDAYDLMKFCIEQANGDSAVFTAFLQSHMQDDKLLAAAAKGRKK